MAVDKAIDSTAFDSKLTTVADAIRTAGGTTEPMSFPSGMVEAITAIQAGGGGGDTLLGYNLLSGTITLAEESTDPITLVEGEQFNERTYGFCVLWNSNIKLVGNTDGGFVGVSALTGGTSFGITSKGDNAFNRKMLWPNDTGKLSLYQNSTYKIEPGTTYCWIMLYKK